MKKLNKRPFEMAEVEIVVLNTADIITTSGGNSFDGEFDEFEQPE